MDITGILQNCAHGDEHFIIAVKHFSKYTVAAQAKNLTSKSVMEFIIREVILQLGGMDFLLSDNASYLTSKTFSDMAKILGFEIHHSSPRNPRSNGMAKNRVKRVKKSTYILPWSNSLDCLEAQTFLPFIQLALNTSIDASRKDTPFFLLHRFEAKSVFDCFFLSKNDIFGRWVFSLLQEVFVIRQICINDLKKVENSQAKQYNKKILEIKIYSNNIVCYSRGFCEKQFPIAVLT